MAVCSFDHCHAECAGWQLVRLLRHRQPGPPRQTQYDRDHLRGDAQAEKDHVPANFPRHHRARNFWDRAMVRLQLPDNVAGVELLYPLTGRGHHRLLEPRWRLLWHSRRLYPRFRLSEVSGPWASRNCAAGSVHVGPDVCHHPFWPGRLGSRASRHLCDLLYHLPCDRHHDLVVHGHEQQDVQRHRACGVLQLRVRCRSSYRRHAWRPGAALGWLAYRWHFPL
mmetsp:Transcript_7897/g.14343  ORF Transcript_7897/g.14343 Transcript_7897/m.14343 type:complete len:223 (+) Transcript_7897:628-1296(+)